MIKIPCLSHQKLVAKGRSGILDYVSSLIISNLEIYFDLDFFDTKIVKASHDSVYVVLKKSILYLPESSCSIQNIIFSTKNSRATITYNTRSNPVHYEGFPDCLNDLGEAGNIIDYILHASKKSRLIGELSFAYNSEYNSVTILDKHGHYDVFLKRDENEGRYSVSKTTSEITDVLHTLVKQKKQKDHHLLMDLTEEKEMLNN